MSSIRSIARAGRRRALPLLLCSALVCATLAMGGCKRGAEGDAQAKEAKGPEAVPVEVAAATHRPIAASYSGTAALEARGDEVIRVDRENDPLA